MPIVKKTANTLETDLSSELILVHGDSGQAFKFNATGRAIYMMLPAERAAIVDTLLNRFDEVDRDTAERDVENILNQMVNQGLATIE